MSSWTDIYTLAYRKGLSDKAVDELIAQGKTKDEIYNYISTYTPPISITSEIGGFLKGIPKGVIGGVLETGLGLSSLLKGVTGIEAPERFFEGLVQKVVPGPEATFGEELGYGLGNIASLIGQTAIPAGAVGRAVGAAGKIARTALPIGVLGTREAGLIYHAQPEEEKSLATAIPAGLASGAIMSIPVGGVVSEATLKGLQRVPAVAERIATKPLRYAIPISAGAEAVSFPILAEATKPVYEWAGLKFESKDEEILFNSLLGALVGAGFGVARGVGLSKAEKLKQELEKMRQGIGKKEEAQSPSERVSPVKDVFNSLYLSTEGRLTPEERAQFKNVLDKVEGFVLGADIKFTPDELSSFESLYEKAFGRSPEAIQRLIDIYPTHIRAGEVKEEAGILPRIEIKQGPEEPAKPIEEVVAQKEVEFPTEIKRIPEEDVTTIEGVGVTGREELKLPELPFTAEDFENIEIPGFEASKTRDVSDLVSQNLNTILFIEGLRDVGVSKTDAKNILTNPIIWEKLPFDLKVALKRPLDAKVWDNVINAIYTNNLSGESILRNWFGDKVPENLLNKVSVGRASAKEIANIIKDSLFQKGQSVLGKLEEKRYTPEKEFNLLPKEKSEPYKFEIVPQVIKIIDSIEKEPPLELSKLEKKRYVLSESDISRAFAQTPGLGVMERIRSEIESKLFENSQIGGKIEIQEKAGAETGRLTEKSVERGLQRIFPDEIGHRLASIVREVKTKGADSGIKYTESELKLLETISKGPGTIQRFLDELATLGKSQNPKDLDTYNRVIDGLTKIAVKAISPEEAVAPAIEEWSRDMAIFSSDISSEKASRLLISAINNIKDLFGVGRAEGTASEVKTWDVRRLIAELIELQKGAQDITGSRGAALSEEARLKTALIGDVASKALTVMQRYFGIDTIERIRELVNKRKNLRGKKFLDELQKIEAKSSKNISLDSKVSEVGKKLWESVSKELLKTEEGRVSRFKGKGQEALETGAVREAYKTAQSRLRKEGYKDEGIHSDIPDFIGNFANVFFSEIFPRIYPEMKETKSFLTDFINSQREQSRKYQIDVLKTLEVISSDSTYDALKPGPILRDIAQTIAKMNTDRKSYKTEESYKQALSDKERAISDRILSLVQDEYGRYIQNIFPKVTYIPERAIAKGGRGFAGGALLIEIRLSERNKEELKQALKKGKEGGLTYKEMPELFIGDDTYFLTIPVESLESFLNGKVSFEKLNIPENASELSKGIARSFFDAVTKIVLKRISPEKDVNVYLDIQTKDRPFIEAFFKSVQEKLITKERLDDFIKKFPDLKLFIENPKEFTKLSLIEAFEDRAVEDILSRQLEESLARIKKTLESTGEESVEIQLRVADVVKSDPSILDDSFVYMRFIKELTAKALGEEIPVLVGKEGSEAVKALRELVGVRFTGFAMKLGDKKILNVVFGNGVKEDIVSLGHEIFHLIEPSLSRNERELLYRKFRNTEAIAEAFGNYVYEKTYQPLTIRKIFDKVVAFIERLKNLFMGYGWRSADDVFDSILAGQYAKDRVSPDAIPLYLLEDVRQIVSGFPDYDGVKFEIAFREKISQAIEEEKKFFDNISDFIQNWKVSNAERKAIEGGFLPERRGVLKKLGDLFISPVFHKYLSPLHNLYKNAYEEVNRILGDRRRVALEAVDYLAEKRPELYDVLQRIVFRLNELFYFPANIEGYVDAYLKGLKTSPGDRELLANALYAIKNSFDAEYILGLKLAFEADLGRIHRFLDRSAKAGDITAQQLSQINTILAEIYAEALNNIFIVSDIRNIDVVRARRQEAIKKVDALTSELAKIFGFDAFSLIEEGIPRTPQGHIYELVSKFIGNNVIKSFQALKDLESIFYFPLIRNGGKYEIRVFQKYTDEKGNTRYIEIMYFDTTRDRFDSGQRREFADIYRAVKEKLDSVGAGRVVELKTTDWHVSETRLGDFLSSRANGADFVILSGPKAPRNETALSKLSPIEAYDVIQSLFLRADLGENHEKMRDLLLEAVNNVYAEESYMLGRFLNRFRLPEGFGQVYVEGYRKDLRDVLVTHFTRSIGNFVNRGYSAKLSKFLSDPENQAFFIENPDIKVLVDKYNDMLISYHNELASFIYKIRAFTSLYFLAFRVSTALLNTMNTFTTFAPEFASVLGALEKGRYDILDSKYAPKVFRKESVSSGLSLADAVRSYPVVIKKVGSAIGDIKKLISKGWLSSDLSRIDIERALRDNASPDEIYLLRVIKGMVDSGTIESGFYQMLREEGLNLFGRQFRRLADSGMFLFRYTEAYSRIASAVALAKEMYKHGFDVERAVEIVRGVIDRTFFDYTRANRPYWANPSTSFGAVASLPTALKGFVLNFLSFIADAVGRKEYAKLASTFGVLFVLGGVSGLPLLDDLADIMERSLSALGYNVPIRAKVRNTLSEHLGSDFAKFITKGLPYVLNLVDFSSAIRTELPFVPKGLSANAFMDAFFGVYKGAWDRVLKGLDYTIDGEYLAGLMFMLPVGIGMPIQAYSLTTEGLKTKYGRSVIEAETGEQFTLTPTEAFVRALGFRPVSLAEVQDTRYFGMRVKRHFEEVRRSIYEKYRRAVQAGDTDVLEELFDEIRKFNESIASYKGIIPPITYRGLKQALKPTRERYKELTALL